MSKRDTFRGWRVVIVTSIPVSPSQSVTQKENLVHCLASRSRHIHYKRRPTLAPHGRIYPISRNLLLFESIIDCPTGDSSIAATVVQRQRLRSPPTAEFSPAAFVVHSATSGSHFLFLRKQFTSKIDPGCVNHATRRGTHII